MVNLLSIQEAADKLGVTVRTLRTWTNNGKVPSLKTEGNHRRYRQSDILEFAYKRTNKMNDLEKLNTLRSINQAKEEEAAALSRAQIIKEEENKRLMKLQEEENNQKIEEFFQQFKGKELKRVGKIVVEQPYPNKYKMVRADCFGTNSSWFNYEHIMCAEYKDGLYVLAIFPPEPYYQGGPRLIPGSTQEFSDFQEFKDAAIEELAKRVK